jgi:hypothetical protein
VKKTNTSVIFPKKYTNQGGNNGGMLPLIYELLLLKRKEDGDDEIILLDEYNKPYKAIIDDGEEFVVVKKTDLYIEEDFYIFGLCPKSDRRDIRYILNQLVLKNALQVVKEITIIKNKLIIFGEKESDVNIVICKTADDSDRLYNKLYKTVKNEHQGESKNIFFLGAVSKYNKEIMYQRVMKATGWDKKKLLRSTTRP